MLQLSDYCAAMPPSVIIYPPDAPPDTREPEPTDISMVLGVLNQRCPALNEKTAIALAHIWKHEVDSILRQAMAYSLEKAAAWFHIQLRDEMALEWTRLTVWVIDRVIEHKLQLTPCEKLEPEAELMAACSPAGQEKIRNTGLNIASHIWIQKLDHWHKRSRHLLEIQGTQRTRMGSKVVLAGQPLDKVTIYNHYIPSFTNRPWADAIGRVAIFSRALDGTVRGTLRQLLRWGCASFLYSQGLEDQLAAIESDATRPFGKLLHFQQFSGHDEQDWVTFLICQFFRTPRFIHNNLNALKRMGDARGWNFPGFPVNPYNLRRVYETLYRAHGVYASYYRSIARKPFWVAVPAPGEFFLKADEPVLISGALRNADSSLVFPLSPDRCFVAGPLFRKVKSPVRIGLAQLEPGQARRLSLQMAYNARETVIASPHHQSEELLSDLAKVMANHPDNLKASFKPIRPFWGESASRVLVDSRI